MPELKVNGNFISEKVSRIRWIPEQYTAPDSFITGSWEFSENSVKIWKISSCDYAGDEQQETIPKCTSSLTFAGDVTGLEFVDADHVVVSSSDGFVSVLHINRNKIEGSLTERYRFKRLHRFANDVKAPCNGLATFEHNVATIGEDGRLNVLAINGTQVVRSYTKPDSCSTNAVAYVSEKEIITGNRIGLINIFDLRADGEEPTASLILSCDDDKKSNGVTSLTSHPTQKYILLAGSEEGSISVWDLRNPSFPASYLNAHESTISELAFHPTEPSRLFTASEGGELFQWSYLGSQIMDGAIDSHLKCDETQQTNPWLSGERIKNKISWTPLINGIRKAINSFDASGPRIVCSSDSEAIYLLENVY